MTLSTGRAWVLVLLAILRSISCSGRSSVPDTLLPDKLWCIAQKQFQTDGPEADLVWAALGRKRGYRREKTCCSLDKVNTVVDYMRVVLDFKAKTMEQQLEFANSISGSLRNSNTRGNPCQELLSKAMLRRVDALEASIKTIQKGFPLVREAVEETMTSHCLLPEGWPWFGRRSKRKAVRLGTKLVEAMLDIEGLARSLTELDLSDWRASENDVFLDLQGCYPAPFLALLQGPLVPRSSFESTLADVWRPFQRPEGNVHTWLVFIDRFCLALSRFSGKLGYQLKMLTKSFDPAYRTGPVASLWWHSSRVVKADEYWRRPNHLPSTSKPDGAGCGGREQRQTLALLISNLTSELVVAAVYNEAELIADSTRGLRVVIVEDSIRAPMETAVRPRHSHLLSRGSRDTLSGEMATSRLEVVWRRHQNTLGMDGFLREFVGSADFRILDFRTASHYSAKEVEDAFRLLWSSHWTQRLVREDGPVDTSRHTKSCGEHLQCLDEYLSYHRNVVSIWRDEGRIQKRTRALVWVCNPFSLCGGHGDRTNGLLTAFLLAILTDRAFFIDFDSPLPLSLLLQPRRKGGAGEVGGGGGGGGGRRDGAEEEREEREGGWRGGASAVEEGEEEGAVAASDVGNHGEGIDQEYVLDWRLTNGGVGLAGQSLYIDDRTAFQSDLEWLITDPSPVLLASTNHREFSAMFNHPLLKDKAEKLGLPGTPNLVAKLWNILFEPTPFFRARLEDGAAYLGLPRPLPWTSFDDAPDPEEKGRDQLQQQQQQQQQQLQQKQEHPQPEQQHQHQQQQQEQQPGFIAIHFRAGNESARLWWDPGRHELSSLPMFLECAALAEKEVGLSPDTPWFLSADTRSILEMPSVAALRSRGKLVVLDEGWQISHVDRSHVDLGFAGFADAYVAYYLLASARALIMSRSYFGETAAEVGAVPDTYFAEGCVKTSLLSS